MGLEDFEKELAQEQADKARHRIHKRKRSSSPHERRHRHHHPSHHQSRHHDSDSHATSKRDENEHSGHRHRRRGPDSRARSPRHRSRREDTHAPREGLASDAKVGVEEVDPGQPQRMAWMQGSAADEFEYIGSKRPTTPPGYFRKATNPDARHKSDTRRERGDNSVSSLSDPPPSSDFSQSVPSFDSSKLSLPPGFSHLGPPPAFPQLGAPSGFSQLGPPPRFPGPSPTPRHSQTTPPAPDVSPSFSEPSSPPGFSRPSPPPGFSDPSAPQEVSEPTLPPGFSRPTSVVTTDLPPQREVDYTFGDAGSEWRLKKLNGVYREAKERSIPVEDVAIGHYGDLRNFDDAREEEIEMDRRQMYGEEYVRKDRPNGDLYEERKLQVGAGGRKYHQADQPSKAKLELVQGEVVKDSVVLNRMENRMLAGGRKGEVKEISGKRGRERGLVEENEDMTIDDMVRQERRTRGQAGGDGRAFAERIAKDGKFDDDLEYMDDNAEKLAKSVQKSDINLRNTSISDYHKMKRVLDSCPLCAHEDTDSPPIAPIVSLGTRTFLTLPTTPEVTPYGLCASIVPTQHRSNLLECDDEEWEEIRNFMKSLTRFYYSLKPRRSVIFYENAAQQGRKRHASLEAIPLPMSVAETIPQYFKEAIMSADEEWTQHKKVIDTLKNSERPGYGKHAFRKSMVSELPYFHVWFRIDGGMGHVVEDPRRWPKGDLFAREIIGGILDVAPENIRKQGRWHRGDSEMRSRVEEFRKIWEKWDWTKALTEAP